MAAAAGGGGGEFSNVWTIAQAASRDPFHLGQFLEIVWENTSGYLLAACLVSMAAALLSWVYVVRAAPPDGPDHQTRTRSAANRTARASVPTSASPAADDADSTSDNASAGGDDASDDTPDDTPASRRPPLPPPSEGEEEEDCGSFEDRQGDVPDLVEMAHHLPARVKQAELRHIRQKLEGDMTEEQQRKEREVERDQMAAILELMQQNSDKFGRPSQDDMQAQLKLYM